AAVVAHRIQVQVVVNAVDHHVEDVARRDGGGGAGYEGHTREVYDIARNEVVQDVGRHRTAVVDPQHAAHRRGEADHGRGAAHAALEDAAVDQHGAIERTGRDYLAAATAHPRAGDRGAGD